MTVTPVNGTPHDDGPPIVYKPDTEMAVLGAVINNPRDLLPLLRSLPDDAFYDPRHRDYRDAVIALGDQGKPIDQYTVLDIAVDTRIHGPNIHITANYLNKILNHGFNAGPDPTYWIDQLLHDADQRRLAKLSIELAQAAAIPDFTDRKARETLIITRYNAATIPAENDNDRFPTVDWHQLFTTDFSTIDWLPGRLLEHGQQAALVGAGKAGKSLFALDWLYHAVTGRGFLGDIPRSPIRVLYLDRENSPRDLYDRLASLGAIPADLQNLDYRLFPRFSGSLDASNLAVTEFMAMVDHSEPHVVVLDTISRFISGKESDSDTWLLVYSRIHAELKRRGIACVRLDHFGKDVERGARGSSAKTQDVDHVWELAEAAPFVTRHEHAEAVQTRLRLTRTHTRTGIGEDRLHIARHGQRSLETGRWITGRTSHELTSAPSAEHDPGEGSTQWLVDQMDTAGLPDAIGRDKAMAWGAAHAIHVSKAKWADALRVRKNRTEQPLPLGDSDI
jgi:hypothetical protein